MQPIDVKVISTMRALAADAIQKANSGHPGTPLGAAPEASRITSGTSLAESASM